MAVDLGADPNPYDATLRVLECAKCGAPISGALEDGALTCRFCGVVNVVARRASMVPAPNEIDESARVAGLWQQLEPGARPSPYGPSMWRGVMTEGTSYGTDAEIVRARLAWTEARAQFLAGREDESRTAAIALLLAAHYGVRHDRMAIRAVLETAIDMVKDPGFRHLLAAFLSRTAAKEGRVEDAEAWLRQCDPRPSDIHLDSQYRMALAGIKIAEGDPKGALDVVGAKEGDVPFEAGSSYPLQIRIHAHEMMGDDKTAFALLDRSFVTHGATVLQWLRVNDFAPRAREAEIKHIWRLRIVVAVIAIAIIIGIPVAIVVFTS